MSTVLVRVEYLIQHRRESHARDCKSLLDHGGVHVVILLPKPSVLRHGGGFTVSEMAVCGCPVLCQLAVMGELLYTQRTATESSNSRHGAQE